MTKQIPVDTLAILDQAEMALINTAKLLGSYYKELLDNKIPEELAFELVKHYHIHLWNMARGEK